MQDQSTLAPGRSLPTKDWLFDGFNLGENTFALATEIKGNELASMVNAELYGKRSIRPSRGGTKLGGTLGGSSVDGLFQFKNSSVNEILGISGGVMKKYNSSTEAWDTVTGVTFTADLKTRGVKMRDNLYLGNGTDDFTRYNGTSLSQFTAVSAPSNLAVVAQGTTGVTSYEYSVTTVTDKGESLESTPVVITNGNETLTATNKNRITFDRKADSQVIGYNVFGRSTLGTGRTLMKFIEQPTSGNITWDDDGTIDPTIWLPPDGDSTDGVKCSIWEQLRGSLVGAGEPSNRHRVFFSGTGSRYESFSPAHNGGWADVRPGDNDEGVNGLAPFEQKIIIAKENSIHQFYFSPTTGDAVIQELITYIGCGAPGSMVVMENEIAFLDSERKLRILGYEPNYTASIRSTSLSEGRVQSRFDEIDPSKLANCEAVYHKGRYLLAATSSGADANNIVLGYDRRYLAFIGKRTGTNAHVKCWQVWDGKDSQKRLFAGSSDSPYVFEYGEEGKITDHDNSAVMVTIRTKNEDLSNSGQQKLWKWADFRIFRIQGTLKIKTIIDGENVIDERSFSVTRNTGWGVKQWGVVQWGVRTGTEAATSNLDKTYRKEIYGIGNSLQFEVTKSGVDDDFILVSMRGEAFLLPTEVFDSENVI